METHYAIKDAVNTYPNTYPSTYPSILPLTYMDIWNESLTQVTCYS